jgi:hypothetical protein
MDATSTRAALWLAFFAGPVAWSLHELLSYALVKLACNQQLMVVEYLVSLATFVLAAAGAYVSYRQGGTHTPRTTVEFIALAALLMNLLFAFTILIEALPQVVVNPCL